MNQNKIIKINNNINVPLLLTLTLDIKYAILLVKTVVLPVPAPATIKRGPSPKTTASFCSLFKPKSKSSFIMNYYTLKKRK